MTGRGLHELSSPSPTLEKSTKNANDTLIKHQQQQLSLQEEAKKTNSRDINIDLDQDILIQDLTTKGHCITIRHAVRVQIVQDKSQG